MSERGFTLIEIAAALAILAMLVVPLLGARNRTVAAAVGASRQFGAVQLAASKLDELSVKRLDEIDRSGTFEGAADCSWAFSVEPEDEEEFPGLYRVTLTVTHPGSSAVEEEDLEMTTLVFSGKKEL